MRRRTVDTIAGVVVMAGAFFVPPLLVAWFMIILVNGFHRWWNFIPSMSFGDAFEIWFPLHIVLYILTAGILWLRRTF